MPTVAANWLRAGGIAPNVIIAWPSTAATIPGGWIRETSLDTRFVRSVVNATTDPGGTGGSATHNHPFSAHSHTGNSHSHTGGPTSGENLQNGNITGSSGQSLFANNHTHTITVTAATTTTSANNASPTNWDNATAEPPFLVVIFIKSLGTAGGFPASSLVYFNAAAPSGWTAHAGSANRWWKGAAGGGDGGGTGGTGDAHTHTSAAHSHTSAGTHTHPLTLSASGTVSTWAALGSGVTSAADHVHTGTVSGAIGPAYSGTATPSSASGDMRPPWKKLLPIENTSGGTLRTLNVIAFWLGTIATIPIGWKICDGNNGTPNMLDVYANGAANSGEVGTTGGAATHTHAAGGSHTHSIDAHIHPNVTTPGAEQGNNTGSSSIVPNVTHTHTTGALASGGSGTSGAQTVSGSANSSNDPVHTRVAFIQFQGP